jgi:hypothetical protein
MIQVSIDFDRTLSREDVQEYVASLIKEGCEVWILTSRYSNEEFPKHARDQNNYNEDLFKVTDSLGIPRERIIFANMEFKYEFILNREGFNPVFHLDDDHIELDGIKMYTHTIAIDVGCEDYREQCNRCLKINHHG